jgi:hypothetical protein
MARRPILRLGKAWVAVLSEVDKNGGANVGRRRSFWEAPLTFLRPDRVKDPRQPELEFTRWVKSTPAPTREIVAGCRWLRERRHGRASMGSLLVRAVQSLTIEGSGGRTRHS